MWTIGCGVGCFACRMGDATMMYSVAVYEYENTRKTTYTRNKDEAEVVFKNAIGACVKVILYYGCYIIGEWRGMI